MWYECSTPLFPPQTAPWVWHSSSRCEMASSHIKQRRDRFVSVLLLGGAYYHQHLRSAQYFPIPRRPLSAFLWLLHSSDIDVGLHSTAPPLTAELSLAIFCLRGNTVWGCFFFLFGGVGGRCWGSQAAPVKNETFTIPLGCKSEFLVLKLGGRIPFMR